jgi:hypothetical protein
MKFGLWWSGSNLSYLRYLTFKTLRFFNPNSEIELYVGKKFKKDGYKWDREQQDFEKTIENNYLDKLPELNVKVIEVDFFGEYAPNFASDIFRYWFLKNFAPAFYLDTDQIILKSFETLPLDKEMIYCTYDNYAPVGVLYGNKNSKIVDYIYKHIPKYYNKDVYNSLGPYMFFDVIKSNKVDISNSYNSPPNYFYPIPYSDMVVHVYSGAFNIPKDSYALHLFMGHPLSQKFNQKYTEEFAKTSSDTISKKLRELKII